jgi:hypothetical protein
MYAGEMKGTGQFVRLFSCGKPGGEPQLSPLYLHQYFVLAIC